MFISCSVDYSGRARLFRRLFRRRRPRLLHHRTQDGCPAFSSLSRTRFLALAFPFGALLPKREIDRGNRDRGSRLVCGVTWTLHGFCCISVGSCVSSCVDMPLQVAFLSIMHACSVRCSYPFLHVLFKRFQVHIMLSLLCVRNHFIAG